MIWETVVSISHIFVAIAVAVAVAAAVLYLPLTSFGCEKNCLYTCPYSISKFFSIKYPSFLFSTEMLKSGPLCTLSFAHMCFLSFCKWKQFCIDDMHIWTFPCPFYRFVLFVFIFGNLYIHFIKCCRPIPAPNESDKWFHLCVCVCHYRTKWEMMSRI